MGNHVLDEVRRRVQQDQLGHRGHTDDPLFQVRRLLRRCADTLTDKHGAKLEAALHCRPGDPGWEVTIAWHCAQRLRAIYHAPTPAAGRALATQLLESLPTCPIPEVARLGRKLRSWRGELLAYFDTDGLVMSGTNETRADTTPAIRSTRMSQVLRESGTARDRTSMPPPVMAR